MISASNGLASLVLALMLCPASAQSPAQLPPPQAPQQPSGTPNQTPPAQQPGSTVQAVPPAQQPGAANQAAPSSQTQGGQSAPLPTNAAKITSGAFEMNGSEIRGTDVTVEIGEYLLVGGKVSGDLEKEVVFTDSPKLTYRGQTITGDTIRFKPKTREFQVDNLHTALTPDFLKSQITTPLFLSGDSFFGQRNRPLFGDNIEATTCILPELPHYLIRASEVKVEPGKRITLKKATFYFFGHRIITLPTFIIPLDRDPKRPHASHLPYVGRSVEEGWFAKSAFDYVLADHAPGIFRLDLMEKKGVGLGVDQAWNLLKSVGIFTLYGIPTSGLNKNLSGRLSDKQDIGGGQTISLDNDFQRNSYLALPSTTTINTRAGYTRNLDGLNTLLNLSRQSSDSGSSAFSGATHSQSLTANYTQGIQLGQSTNINFNTDYSQYATSTSPLAGQTTGGFSQRTEQLATRFTADQRASNYMLELNANKNFTIGSQSQQSFFGGAEKLPEVTLSNYRFTGGPLSRIPATFMISAGKYSEGAITTTGSGTGPRTFSTERAIAGFDINGQRFGLTRSTDLNVSGGFQQFFYGDGSAQYILRNNTTLSQRWGHKSGVNLNYTYQQPEGGSPFRFDQQGKFHALNADAGLLDDQRLQLTARVGYDFSQASFGGLKTPWQTLSANLLVRPVDWARSRTLLSFDPNTGQFVAATTDLRFRGHNDFSFDVVGRFDPRVHKFGQLNSYLNLPIGSMWRVIALVQYNGYLSRFESRNLQIQRTWDCLEASLIYIDNPYGFQNDRQIYFNIRIKAFPFFQKFGVGQFGQAIDTGVGDTF